MSALSGVVETIVVRRRIHSRSKVDGENRSSLPEYKIWAGMLARCNNPKGKAYRHYGARGIRVCARWMEDFENFYRDMGPRPSARHSIDRIDNDGNYEPGNCRWATPREQVLNRGFGMQAWAPKDYETLRAMYVQYFSLEEIAVALNRSVATVRLRAHMEGLRRESFLTRLVNKNRDLHSILVHGGKEDFLAAVDKRAEDRKAAEIARVEAEKREKAAKIVAAASSGQGRNEKMRDMRLAGASLSEIGKQFGITRERVRQIEAKGFPVFADNPCGEGRKISSTNPKVRDQKIHRLCRAWNSASREARAMFIDAAQMAIFRSLDVDQVKVVADQLGSSCLPEESPSQPERMAG